MRVAEPGESTLDVLDPAAAAAPLAAHFFRTGFVVIVDAARTKSRRPSRRPLTS